MRELRSDSELVLAAQADDPAAYGHLFERWYDRAWNVARSILRNDEQAGDVAQEALVGAWQRLDQLDDPDAFGGWLLRSTRNRALNLLSREGRSRATGDEVVSGLRDRGLDDPVGAEALPQPDAVSEIRDRQELVWVAANALGERDASLLDLHLRHGLTPAEIADELGVAPNAAHQQLFKLRGRLGEAIGSYLLWRNGRPLCDSLAEAVSGNTAFDRSVAKAVARHQKTCDTCSDEREALVDPTKLFAAVPLVLAPPVLKAQAAAALTNAGVPLANSGGAPSDGGSSSGGPSGDGGSSTSGSSGGGGSSTSGSSANASAGTSPAPAPAPASAPTPTPAPTPAPVSAPPPVPAPAMASAKPARSLLGAEPDVASVGPAITIIDEKPARLTLISAVTGAGLVAVVGLVLFAFLGNNNGDGVALESAATSLPAAEQAANQSGPELAPRAPGTFATFNSESSTGATIAASSSSGSPTTAPPATPRTTPSTATTATTSTAPTTPTTTGTTPTTPQTTPTTGTTPTTPRTTPTTATTPTTPRTTPTTGTTQTTAPPPPEIEFLTSGVDIGAACRNANHFRFYASWSTINAETVTLNLPGSKAAGVEASGRRSFCSATGATILLTASSAGGEDKASAPAGGNPAG